MNDVNQNGRKGKGVCLLSGGLDSQLAICVLREQGLHVEAIVFSSPFFKINAAKRAAENLKVELHVVSFTQVILGLVSSPKHGFGGAMNPCIDCHAAMIRRAGEWMIQKGFDFVATGEVLNQRPMSQNRRSLDKVEKDAGLQGRLLRPLSARLLEPTLPELEGIVDRERLLDFSGRCRKPQMELAKRLGVIEYPSPAGGCLLTEKGFCRKLSDLKTHEGFADERLVWLLLYGRHFRLPGGAKCIVGRDAHDNSALRKMLREGDLLVHTVNVPGPTLLIPQGASPEDLEQAGMICAAHGDHGDHPEVTIRVRTLTDEGYEITVPVEGRDRFVAWMR